MNWLKSHFACSKQQRNGIFALLIVIVGLQITYSVADFSQPTQDIDTNVLATFEREIDSLKQLAIARKKPKIYPFNPNYISDYKGYTLGMSPQEIDRLHQFRKQQKWINSVADFQQVTKVSDSLLKTISPYFKFPEWVTKAKSKTVSKTKYYSKPKPTDINTATAEQLKQVSGIGDALSARIIRYREKFNGGFASMVELQAIYGLKPEVIERVKQRFFIANPRSIKTFHLNTVTKSQLVTIPYIDYEVAHQIIEQRTLREGFKNFDELLKIQDFPTQKIEIIKLYLTLN